MLQSVGRLEALREELHFRNNSSIRHCHCQRPHLRFERVWQLRAPCVPRVHSSEESKVASAGHFIARYHDFRLVRSHAVEHLAQLESYRAEHLDDYTIEFIETQPGISTAEPALKYGLEGGMAHLVGAIDHNALATEQAREVLDRLGLAHSSRALRTRALHLADSLTVANVSSVSQRRNDESLFYSKILPAER